MKVSITIAEKRDGTFEVLYCGNDAQAALDACLQHDAPDTKEVCMFRKPFHYKRKVPPAVGPNAASPLAGQPSTETEIPPPAENEPSVLEAEVSGESFLGEPPAPAQPGRRGRRRS